MPKRQKTAADGLPSAIDWRLHPTNDCNDCIIQDTNRCITDSTNRPTMFKIHLPALHGINAGKCFYSPFKIIHGWKFLCELKLFA